MMDFLSWLKENASLLAFGTAVCHALIDLIGVIYRRNQQRNPIAAASNAATALLSQALDEQLERELGLTPALAEIAMRAAFLSYGNYCPEKAVSSGSVSSFEDPHFLLDEQTSSTSRTLFLSVRGSTTPGDWLMNASIIGFNGYGKTEHGIAVHQAWLSRAEAIYEKIKEIDFFQECGEEEAQSDPPYHLVLTGHSMGGAVACLLAILIHNRMRWRGGKITVMTFGQPAFGTNKDVRRLASLAHSVFRFVNEGDLIPSIMGLEHVGYVLVCGPSKFYRFHSHSTTGQALADLGLRKKLALLSALAREQHSIVKYLDSTQSICSKIITEKNTRLNKLLVARL